MDKMTELSTDFLSLVAEAIGLPKDSFVKYYDGIGESESGTKRQDKLKIIKYPDLAELGEDGRNAQGGVSYSYPQFCLFSFPFPPYLILIEGPLRVRVHDADGCNN